MRDMAKQKPDTESHRYDFKSRNNLSRGPAKPKVKKPQKVY
jgi:hypothetical protein